MNGETGKSAKVIRYKTEVKGKKGGGEARPFIIGNLLELAGPEIVDKLLPLFRGGSGS